MITAEDAARIAEAAKVYEHPASLSTVEHLAHLSQTLVGYHRRKLPLQEKENLARVAADTVGAILGLMAHQGLELQFAARMAAYVELGEQSAMRHVEWKKTRGKG